MLSVIIPAYNEGSVIEETLGHLIDSLSTSDLDFEILVVDDGSVDDTAEVVRGSMANEPRINLISYRPNHGKGYAIRCGLNKSYGDFIVLFDADLDIPPSCINVLYSLLLAGSYDGVIGSKAHDDSFTNLAWVRRLITRFTNLIVQLLFRLPFKDTQVGVKVFRKKVIEAVLPELKADGFTADVELLYWAHRKGYIVAEGPVTINQTASTSSVRMCSIIRATTDLISLFFRTRVPIFSSGNHGRS